MGWSYLADDTKVSPSNQCSLLHRSISTVPRESVNKIRSRFVLYQCMFQKTYEYTIQVETVISGVTEH